MAIPAKIGDPEFDHMVDRARQGKCPGCGKDGDQIIAEGFRDQRSINEFRITHMCQQCQNQLDEYYAKMEEEDDCPL